MAELKTQYIIELLRQGQGAVQAEKELRDVQRQMASTSDIARTLTRSLAQLGLGFSIGAIVHESMRAFSESELAITKLNGALRASGQFSEGYSKELQNLASELEKVTKFTDETVLSVQQQLLVFGAAHSQIPQLTETVLNMASGMGVDATSAAFTLGRALSGEFAGIQRQFGLRLRENASDSEKFAQVIEQLGTKFSGLARAEGNTLTGELAKMKNAVNNLQEEFGALILQALIPAARRIRELADPKNREELEKLIAVLKIGILTMGEFGVATLAMRGWGLTTAAFGAGWLKSMADVRAATALTGGAIVSMAASIAAGLGLATASLLTLLEGVKALQAADQMSKSNLGLADQNLALRKQLEAKINEGESGGRIGRKQADDMRTELISAFTPDQVEGPADEFGRTITRPSRNLERESDTVRRQLKTFISQGPPAATDGAAAKALTKEQIEAVMKLQALELDLQALQTSGFERERLDAEKAFNERGAEMEKEMEIAGTSLATRQNLRAENDATLLAQIAEINAKEIEAIEKRREAERQAVDEEVKENLQAVADEKNLRNELTLATLDGFARERLQAEVNHQKFVTQIGEIQGLDRTRLEELIQLSAQARDLEIRKIQEAQAAETRRKDNALSGQRELQTMHQSLSGIVADLEDGISKGLATGILDFATGVENAGEKMKKFFSDLLRGIAEAILQMLILRALAGIFGGTGYGYKLPAAAARGGLFPALDAPSGFGGSVAHLAAGGGLFPAPRMMAAGGIAGAMKLDSPTYFPKFNMIAGEAGTEWAAVLSHPRMMEFGGMPAMVGNAGGNQLALMNASDVARSQSGGSGPIVIEVRYSRDTELRVENRAAERAVVRVTQEIRGGDTALSQAVKSVAL